MKKSHSAAVDLRRNPQYLAKLARSAHVNQNIAGDLAYEKLMRCVARLLDENQENVLERACKHILGKYDDPELFALMIDSMQSAAQNLDLGETVASLFAIPVYVTPPADQAREVVDSQAFDQVLDLLRSTGLVHDDVSVLLLPRLLSPSRAFAMSLADVRNLLLNKLVGVFAGEPLFDFPGKEEVEAPAGRYTRYLLGCIVSDVSDNVPFLDNMLPDSSSALAAPAPGLGAAGWAAKAPALLAQAFGVDAEAVRADSPAAYLSALAAGTMSEGLRAVRRGAAALAEQGYGYNSLRAVTSHHITAAGKREIRVVLESRVDNLIHLTVTINLPPVFLCEHGQIADLMSKMLVKVAGREMAACGGSGDGIFGECRCSRCGGREVFRSIGGRVCPQCDSAAFAGAASADLPTESK